MEKWLRRLSWRIDVDSVIRWATVFIVSLGIVVLAISYTLKVEQINFTTLMLPIAGLIAFFSIVVAKIDLKRICVALIILDIPFQIDMFLGWDEPYGDLGTMAGLPLSVTTFMLVILYGLWIAELLIEGKPVENRPRFFIGYPLIFYILVIFLSIWISENQLFGFYQLGLQVQMFLLFAYFAGTIRKREDVMFVLIMIMVAVALEGFYVIFQRATGGGSYVSGQDVYDFRVSGHFGGPNAAGAFFSVLVIPLLPLIQSHTGKFYKLLTGFSIGIGVLSLFLTLSRGAWLAFVIGIALYVTLMFYRGWLSISLPVIIALAISGIIVAFPSLLINRLFGDDGGAGDGRVPLNYLAWDIIEANPILGVGANNFAVAAPDYLGPQYTRIWFYTVHNKYLLVWSETGTSGLIAFSIFLLTTLWRGWLVWLSDDRFLASVAIALVAGVIGHMTHLQADVFNGRASIQMLTLIAALISALLLTIREKNHTQVNVIDSSTLIS